MEAVSPLRGLRYNPEHVRLGGVLAPPYDVITDAQREALYARDLRNIVRIDSGIEYPDDVPGRNDRYTRAAEFLRGWKDLGILVRDDHPAFYVTDHEFHLPQGGVRHRRGLLGVVPALPWDEAPLRPHERTLSAPKEDRLALLRATRTQTSPVFALWSGADGIDQVIAGVVEEPPLLGGRTDGEAGSEKHLLWRAADPAVVSALREALAAARLYVADGHHRYETAVTYAAERRAAAPKQRGHHYDRCLVYLAAAGDPSLTILPTHRLVRPGHGVAFSLDDLWARLDDAWDVEPSGTLTAALAAAARLRATHHAFAAIGRDGTAVLSRARGEDGSPRRRLDAVVLETEVLAPAGIGEAAITGGALAYTRDPAELERAIAAGEAVLGFGLQPVSAAEMIAVADADETMPQKSTYFYPKVPTGLVLHET